MIAEAADTVGAVAATRTVRGAEGYTQIVGRERELRSLAGMLRDMQARVVTLTGAGGSGKTRLAVELARRHVGDFAAGAVFVDLAPLRGSELVVAAIARALDVRAGASEPLLTTVSRAIGRRQLLLVLDNFEHVLDAAGEIGALVAACPRLTVLVTSRAPLRVARERLYDVPPLTRPAGTAAHSLSRLRRYDAIALFTMRAQAVDPGFKLTASNATAVVQIVTRVDGLPLAIELAAARTRTLTPAALLAALERSPLAALTSGARDAPVRQQTLRATIAWSYQLLSAGQQRVLAELSVFDGGFTIDAAQAVCGEGESDFVVLDALAALVDHSLIKRVTTATEEPRFAMLETIGEYAAEQLAIDTAARAARRHARYFAQLAERAKVGLRGRDQFEWVDRLDSEQANLRAALAWSRATGEHEHGLRIIGALWKYWRWRYEFQVELRGWLDDVMPRVRADRALQAQALLVHGQLTQPRGLAGDEARCAEILERCIALSEQIGQEAIVAEALAQLAFVLGAGERSDALFRRAEMLARAVGDDEHQTRVDLLIAWAFRGARADARRLEDDLLARLEAQGDQIVRRIALNNFGEAALLHDELSRARALLGEARITAAVVANKAMRAVVDANLGLVALLSGELDESEQLLRQALEVDHASGWRSSMRELVTGLAGVAARRGDLRRAATLAAVANAIVGGESFDTELMVRKRYLEPARDELGEKAWTAAAAAVEHSDLDTLIELALAG